MNHSQLKRSPLCNLKNYEVTLSTSFETKHGISGHLFEMIEYFYHFTFHKKVKTAILISDGTTYDDFFNSLLNKYYFTEEELLIIKNNTFFKFQPMTIIANLIIFVDGSLRTKNADIFATKKIFLRCSEDQYLEDADLVLQDFDLYPKLNNSKNYKKKILFSKFKKNEGKILDIGMFYATGNSRVLSKIELEELTDRHKFNKYIILSNKLLETPSNVELLQVPVSNLWDSFGTYIYTGLTNITKIDCSSRFIAECKHYNKPVIYDNFNYDKGLEVRKRDLENNIDLELKEEDEIYKLITTI